MEAGPGEVGSLWSFLRRKLNHGICSRLRVAFVHYEDISGGRRPAKREEVIVLSLCECELEKPLPYMYDEGTYHNT